MSDLPQQSSLVWQARMEGSPGELCLQKEEILFNSYEYL